MGYRLPLENPLAFLQSVIQALTLAYGNGNPIRVACITLANRLSDKFTDDIAAATKNQDEKLVQLIEAEAVDVLEGILAFTLVFIKDVEYKGKDPTTTNYYFFQLGSSFYTVLSNLLKISDTNPLTAYDQLNFIYRAYKYIGQQDDDAMFENIYWPNKKALMNSIYLTLEKIIQKQQPVINALITESPDFYALKESIRHVIVEYRKEAESRAEKNESRQGLVNLLEFVNAHCLEVSHSHRENSDEDLQSYIQYSQSDTLKGGLLLPLLKQEYAKSGIGMWRRLQGSRLAELCNEALNIQYTTDIPYETQVDYLKALLHHINWLKKHRKEAIETWEMEHGSLQLAKYTQEITDFYKEAKRKAGQSSVSDSYLRSLASSAAQYGITLTVTKIAKDAAIQGLKTAILGSGPAGMVTFVLLEGANAVLFDASTTILLREMGSYLADTILPKAISRLYMEVLGKISDTIGGTAMGAVQLSVTSGYQGIKNLLGFYQSINPNDKEYIENTEWILTLLELPDELFSKEKKEKILKTRDVFPGLHRDPEVKLVTKPLAARGM